MENNYAINSYYEEKREKGLQALRTKLEQCIKNLVSDLESIESKANDDYLVDDYSVSIRLYEIEDITMKVKTISKLLGIVYDK